MTSPKMAVRLADLEKPVGDIILPNGREVPVRALDGNAEQVRQSIADGTAKPGDMWKLAALLLPTATEEEVRSLSAGAIGIVTQMACGNLESVLELAKAAGKVEASSPAAPSSPLGIG